ncbi:MAG: cohesin domain-containing protein [Saprospiraceae bacterium]
MLRNILFCKSMGGAILLLLIFILPTICLIGQTSSCYPVSCNSSTYVQIIPDPDHPNISGCQATTPCGGGNQFHDQYYKVRLVTFPTNGIYEFDLDYENLDITIEQIVPGPPGSLGLSHIDGIVTQSCFDQTVSDNGWDVSIDDGNGGFTNGVTLTTDEHTANIVFTNDVFPCPEAAIIHFSATQTGNCPGNLGLPCSITELFTVVVHAYPGEAIRLEPTLTNYDPSSGGYCIIPQSSFGSTTTTAALPDAPNANPNLHIEVELGAPTLNADGVSYDIDLASKIGVAVNIDYLEFLLTIANDKPIVINVDSDYDRPIVPGSMGDNNIHFIVPDEGWVLPANGSINIGSINIRPELSNIEWNAMISFADAGKSRIQSNLSGNEQCTSLILGGSQTINNPGLDDCNFSNEGVRFTIIADNTLDCTYPFTQKVKVGFVDDDLPYGLVALKELSFNLDIQTTGPVVFESASLPASGWSDCPSSSNTCLPDPCYTASSSSGHIEFSYCVNIDPNSSLLLNIQPAPDAFMELTFTGAGCIDAISITSLSIRRNGDQESCIPVYDEPPYQDIPICFGGIYGIITTDIGEGVEEVQVTIEEDPNASQPAGCNSMSCPAESFNGGIGTGDSGGYGFCPCDDCDFFKVTPFKDDNPLNGVTTYDLVLISKHILGIEPLWDDNNQIGSPYKWIAGDANRSNSLTQLDIVELRKLILGIYQELPNSTSWRFVDKSYSIPYPITPQSPAFPEIIDNIDKSASNLVSNDFIAIKVGDVNNTAVAHSRPALEDRPVIPLNWPEFRGQVGDVITIPIAYNGAEQLEALQMGIKFDPNILQLISPSIGDLPDWSQGSFNLANAASGEIKTLWLSGDLRDPSQLAKTGDVLFYLTFKVVASIPESGLPIHLDYNLLNCLAWPFSGVEHKLVHQTTTSQRKAEVNTKADELAAVCHPNPGVNELNISVESPLETKARIALFGPFGNRVIMRDVQLSIGNQEIHIPEVASLPAGVYSWKLYFKGHKAQGHWVKI